MKRYSVVVKEVNYGCVTVESETEKDIKEKAEIAVEHGEVIWDESELEIVKWDEEEEAKE